MLSEGHDAVCDYRDSWLYEHKIRFLPIKGKFSRQNLHRCIEDYDVGQE